jgi:hypothetical protein
METSTNPFIYKVIIMIQDQDRIDVENAQFGDWVYFTEEYDAGNVIVPEETGG